MIKIGSIVQNAAELEIKLETDENLSGCQIRCEEFCLSNNSFLDPRVCNLSLRNKTKSGYLISFPAKQGRIRLTVLSAAGAVQSEEVAVVGTPFQVQYHVDRGSYREGTVVSVQSAVDISGENIKMVVNGRAFSLPEEVSKGQTAYFLVPGRNVNNIELQAAGGAQGCVRFERI